MTPEKKKEIQTRLKEALLAEHLYNAKAAHILNFNPAYINMMLNKKMWDHCPARAWNRVEEALRTGKISDFKIPDGEPLYEARKKASKRADADMFCKVGHPFSSPDPELVKKLLEKTPVSAGTSLTPIRNGRKMTEEELQKAIDKTDVPVSPENNITQRLRVALDIEITLIVNGQKVAIA